MTLTNEMIWQTESEAKSHGIMQQFQIEHFQMLRALFSEFKHNLFLALDNKLNFHFCHFRSRTHLIKTHVLQSKQHAFVKCQMKSVRCGP